MPNAIWTILESIVPWAMFFYGFLLIFMDAFVCPVTPSHLRHHTLFQSFKSVLSHRMPFAWMNLICGAIWALQNLWIN